MFINVHLPRQITSPSPKNPKKGRKLLDLGFLVYLAGLHINRCLETRKKLKYECDSTRISFFPQFHAI